LDRTINFWNNLPKSQNFNKRGDLQKFANSLYKNETYIHHILLYINKWFTFMLGNDIYIQNIFWIENLKDFNEYIKSKEEFGESSTLNIDFCSYNVYYSKDSPNYDSHIPELYIYISNTKTILSTLEKNNNSTFYLYVTGITDTNEQIEYWKNVLKNKILEKIPKNFTNIEIIYYDPINYGYDMDVKEKNELIVKYKKELTSYEPNKRVTKSKLITNFFPIPFDDIKKRKYLILDLAHIFEYTNIPYKVTYENSTYNYHVLYLGYLGQNQISDGWYNRSMVEIDFVEINSDGTLNTWVDKILELGYNIESPNDYTHYITDFFSDFVKTFYKKFRTSYVNKYQTSNTDPNRIELFDKIESILKNEKWCIKILQVVTFNVFTKKLSPEQVYNALVSAIGAKLLNVKPANIDINNIDSNIELNNILASIVIKK
jgi:hypothetical protein